MPHDRTSRYRASWLAGILMVLLPGTAAAEDLYFVIVYGAQRRPINQPRYTHTWATFVHLNGCGPDPRTYQATFFTISWLPATLEIKPGRLRPEQGRNLTHAETVAWCEQNCMEIAQFGPYQTRPELFELCLHRWGHLERGEFQYRATDVLNGRAWREVCNCIYAVLDFDERDPAIRPVTFGFGYRASAFVTRRLQSWYSDGDREHHWVSEMIGAQTYPTVRVGPAARLRN
jgi:hypothetical protein